MSTDLFAALLDKENPRGHPILAALLYGFCPAAARWWLAGADPVIPFDPLWRALEDIASGSILKETLSSYGFEDLLDIAQTYVGQVDAWRSRHPGIHAPEMLPTFSGGRIEMSRRFGQRAAIRKFGDRWDNFFAYIRAWAFVASDWEARLRFSEPPHFSQIRLALMLPGTPPSSLLSSLVLARSGRKCPARGHRPDCERKNPGSNPFGAGMAS